MALQMWYVVQNENDVFPSAPLSLWYCSQCSFVRSFVVHRRDEKGVGSLEAEGAASSDFYEQIAQFAKRKGVTISVISIKGTETKLEKLGALADITRGYATQPPLPLWLVLLTTCKLSPQFRRSCGSSKP